MLHLLWTSCCRGGFPAALRSWMVLPRLYGEVCRDEDWGWSSIDRLSGMLGCSPRACFESPLEFDLAESFAGTKLGAGALAVQGHVGVPNPGLPHACGSGGWGTAAALPLSSLPEDFLSALPSAALPHGPHLQEAPGEGEASLSRGAAAVDARDRLEAVPQLQVCGDKAEFEAAVLPKGRVPQDDVPCMQNALLLQVLDSAYGQGFLWLYIGFAWLCGP
mmetsp:Transcript_62916/g.149937  ORF Transcript_62916/g.149937 Transcript_62916/m.149937 type:complete len:219 (+) Transcript_62916:655-1311(+)